MLKLKVSHKGAGERLDVYLCGKISELNRSAINKLIEGDKVSLNSTPVKSGYKVKAGDKVMVNVDLKTLGKTEEIDLPIIYEDDDCLVIDKPAGVLTHSKGTFNSEGTVASFIAGKVTGMDGNRAGIVHRLDRGTSGVIICAKTPEALKWLQKQFSTRKVHKTYVAVVSGQPEKENAVIDMPIERHPRHPQTFRTSPTGKPAITEYRVIRSTGTKSMLELKPKTGRTHQLRVHLSKVGHPIAGDTFYGGTPADRVYLHAVSLELTLPNKERKVFESPLPEEFEAILEA